MPNTTVLLDARGDAESLAEAELWWRRSCNGGHSGAHYSLGALINEGGGAGAETLWREAADAGNVDAQLNVGVLLYQHGGDESLHEAELWWRRASDAGCADAQYNLGALLLERGDAASSSKRNCGGGVPDRPDTSMHNTILVGSSIARPPWIRKLRQNNGGAKQLTAGT